MGTEGGSMPSDGTGSGIVSTELPRCRGLELREGPKDLLIPPPESPLPGCQPGNFIFATHVGPRGPRE